jgi:hypothetical protein
MGMALTTNLDEPHVTTRADISVHTGKQWAPNVRWSVSRSRELPPDIDDRLREATGNASAPHRLVGFRRAVVE